MEKWKEVEVGPCERSWHIPAKNATTNMENVRAHIAFKHRSILPQWVLLKSSSRVPCLTDRGVFVDPGPWDGTSGKCICRGIPRFWLLIKFRLFRPYLQSENLTGTVLSINSHW